MRKEVIICDGCSKVIEPRKGIKIQGNIYVIEDDVNSRSTVVGMNLPYYEHQEGPKRCEEIDKGNASANTLYKDLEDNMGLIDKSNVIGIINDAIKETDLCLDCAEVKLIKFDRSISRRKRPITKKRTSFQEKEYNEEDWEEENED